MIAFFQPFRQAGLIIRDVSDAMEKLRSWNGDSLFRHAKPVLVAVFAGVDLPLAAGWFTPVFVDGK